MADAETSRLCEQIVYAHFGPLTAKVASTLLTRGRLALVHLTRFSSLKPRIVRACILVLVQHNILWHSETDEDGEVFEMNVDECLLRVRFGRFVWQAEQLFGKAAAEIVQIILDHGKLRPPDVMSKLSASDAKSSAIYNQTFYKLVSSSYLKPSSVLSHVSPRDKRIRYEAEEKVKISGFPTAKELRHAKEMAGVRLKKEEQEAESVGLKRKPKESVNGRSTKQRKVADDDVIVDDKVYFRVNFDKFSVHIRNKLIETAAKERFNDGAALVMRAALNPTETNQSNISEIRSDPTSIANIALQLDEDDERLAAGVVLPSSRRPSVAALVKDYLGLLASADNPTPAGRAASFVALSGSKVTVEFEIICRRLRRRILEAVTRERHGDEGVRIVRLLLDTGKMDEKQISKISMIAPKDVRPLLSALSSDSLISIQEVPKSADRNPSRSFFLWFVDLHKAYAMILWNMYKTLFNIGLRKRAEQEEPHVKAVLDKCERTDVSEDESLLTRMEREVLQEWEIRQDKLNVLELRVDETIFVLRDLASVGIEDD